MKANELRIGNIIEYNNKEIGIVSGIQDFLINNGKIAINQRLDIFYHTENVNPIPLTEEWLLKFDWNGYIPLHFNSNFEIDKQGRLYCNSDYKGINVNYVHQLQNLYFALTGEELQIKKL